MSASQPTLFGARLLTAMVTPFDGDLSLDLPRAAQLATRILDQGSQGLIVNGTTGESPTISRPERLALFEAVAAAVPPDAVLVANIGDNCTQDSVAFAQKVAALRGGRYNALMAVTPYYNKPPQAGLYRHFRAIAQSVDVPVVLYNIPGRCVVNIEPDTIIALANDVPNIRALKQANADLAQLDTIVAHTPDDFAVYAGDDALTLPLMQHGGAGVISTVGNIASTGMRAMIDAFLAGESDQANALDAALRPLETELFTTANPILVKQALALVGFAVGGLRLPLIDATDEQADHLRVVIEDTFAGLDRLLTIS